MYIIPSQHAGTYRSHLRQFSRSGYEAASKNFRAEDLQVDISHRSFMITGANSGVGKSVALAIAKRGGTVHMVCRNRMRGEAAMAEIMAASGNQV